MSTGYDSICKFQALELIIFLIRSPPILANAKTELTNTSAIHGKYRTDLILYTAFQIYFAAAPSIWVRGIYFNFLLLIMKLTS